MKDSDDFLNFSRKIITVCLFAKSIINNKVSITGLILERYSKGSIFLLFDSFTFKTASEIGI